MVYETILNNCSFKTHLPADFSNWRNRRIRGAASEGDKKCFARLPRIFLACSSNFGTLARLRQEQICQPHLVWLSCCRFRANLSTAYNSIRLPLRRAGEVGRLFYALTNQNSLTGQIRLLTWYITWSYICDHRTWQQISWTKNKQKILLGTFDKKRFPWN